MANSFRTQGVDPATLRSTRAVSVSDLPDSLRFLPSSPHGTGLIFVCGSGVAANAYAPLLRPIADEGCPVFIIKLPYRFALLESHRQAAIERVFAVVASHPEIPHWVVAGHSLGAALACRVVQDHRHSFTALVLIGTTHPKQDDLSSLPLPITKVYASLDGVAPADKVHQNWRLLPPHTKRVLIEGGNHSQFGHYGHQFLDGTPQITREAQQAATRAELLAALRLPLE
jgi:pimeloyl-ACP methyl ester carboxylesterase